MIFASCISRIAVVVAAPWCFLRCFGARRDCLAQKACVRPDSMGINMKLNWRSVLFFLLPKNENAKCMNRVSVFVVVVVAVSKVNCHDRRRAAIAFECRNAMSNVVAVTIYVRRSLNQSMYGRISLVRSHEIQHHFLACIFTSFDFLHSLLDFVSRFFGFAFAHMKPDHVQPVLNMTESLIVTNELPFSAFCFSFFFFGFRSFHSSQCAAIIAA